MAETVGGLRVSVKVTGTVTGTDGAMLPVNYSYERTFTEGTGTDQIGSVWKDDTRSLATTSEDLDIAGGVTDFQGAASAFNNVKVLWFQNLDTDSGDLFYLKPGSTAPVTSILGGTTPTLTIGPGGLCLLINPIDGYAVTAASADKIAVQSADNSDYQILIAGDNA